MYPAITDADIFNLPFPPIPDDVAERVTRSVRAARMAKAAAASTFEAAKRGVELAIQDGELAAMDYLKHVEGVI